MTPAQVIEEIKISSLRGRGGGGFPTGPSGNPAPGQPGSPLRDLQRRRGRPRRLHGPLALGGRPPRVLEGMILGAYAIGAHQGYIYCRAEYPLAVKHAHHRHRPGRAPWGSWARTSWARASPSTTASTAGAGAFVCGEIHGPDDLPGGQGRRAQAQVRPLGGGRASGAAPQPEQRGDLGQRAPIIEKGGEWFARPAAPRHHGHQGLLAGGQGQQHGPGGGAHGHLPAEIVYEHRRRHPRRRRPSRPCRPAAPRAAASPSPV